MSEHESMSDNDHVKLHIQKAIDRARGGVGDKIDEIDSRLRSSLDIRQQARDHAPQLVAAGLTVGFLIGIGVGRTAIRLLQFGVPIAIATKLVKSRLQS